MLPWQALVSSNVSWGIYGHLSGQPQVLVPNSVSCVVALFVIVMLGRETPAQLPVRIVLPIALGLSLLVTLPLPQLFGFLTVLPSFVGWLVQLVRIRKTGRPVGFSFAGLLLFLLCQSVWLAYALARQDLALITAAVPLILVGGLTVVGYVLAPHAESAGVPGPPHHDDLPGEPVRL